MPSTRFRVAAGPHARRFCPVSVRLDDPVNGSPVLKDMKSGLSIPGQCETENGQSGLFWVIDALEAGEEREYEFVDPGNTGGEPAQYRVALSSDTDASRVDIHLDGHLFTAYHHGADLARPFCYPVNDTLGSGVTRGPAGEKPGETTDHVHHRSLWTAYGEVNETDNWSEEKGHGRTVHRRFERMESGMVFGRLRAVGDWTTAEGATLLREIRDIRVYATGDDSSRIMDVDLDLEATGGPVHFGDTKEGGFMSIRVATTMDASRGGKIENSYGAIGESESWGRRAFWCDYSGTVDGHRAGIAVMENPDTFRSPTYWHVRDYGLMGTNPFGVGTFTRNREQSGAFTLPSGGHLRFMYRVVVHLGDAKQADIAGAYHQYINPPTVTITG